MALLSGQSVHIEMPAEDFAGIDRHGTVEEDGKVRHAVGSLETLNVKQESLSPANSERRNNDGAAPPGCPIDHIVECVLRILSIVEPVPVCRFHQ